jgi:hypothetical protein
MFMKITSLKKLVITLILLSSVVYIGSASAHDQFGALGAAAEATDMYRVTCYDSNDGSGASDHLFVQVIGSNSGNKVSAQVFKGKMAVNTTESVVVDKVLSQGDGDYTLTVDKSAAGPASYLISYHCQSLSGNHTGTDLLPIQDQ